MTDRPIDLHIDHLELRMRGITPETARAAVHGLGEALLHHVAQQPPAEPASVERLDAGTVRVQQTSPHTIREAAAQRLAHTLAAPPTRRS